MDNWRRVYYVVEIVGLLINFTSNSFHLLIANLLSTTVFHQPSNWDFYEINDNVTKQKSLISYAVNLSHFIANFTAQNHGNSLPASQYYKECFSIENSFSFPQDRF